MSPFDRSKLVGISSSLIPSEATIRPGAPAATLEFREFSNSGGSHPSSSSAPPSTNASARLSVTMKLGFASTKCGSSVGFASATTLTLSPPISRATDARSGVVATTLSCAVACALKKEIAPSPSAAILLIIFVFMLVDGLELVCGVGANQELELDPQ